MVRHGDTFSLLHSTQASTKSTTGSRSSSATFSKHLDREAAGMGNLPNPTEPVQFGKALRILAVARGFDRLALIPLLLAYDLRHPGHRQPASLFEQLQSLTGRLSLKNSCPLRGVPVAGEKKNGLS